MTTTETEAQDRWSHGTFYVWILPSVNNWGGELVGALSTRADAQAVIDARVLGGAARVSLGIQACGVFQVWYQGHGDSKHHMSGYEMRSQAETFIAGLRVPDSERSKYFIVDVEAVEGAQVEDKGSK